MKTQPQTIEILGKLIGFDTVSRNSNLSLIEYVADFLDQQGMSCELVYGDDRNKANLWTSFGPDDVAGTVLSGHTDVVPVDGQDWSSDPFSLTTRDSKLHGRGSCDMKGFIAVCLSRAANLKTQPLKRPIHFAFSFDEEVGCIGVRYLIDQLRQRETLPATCIIGEPTGMQVIRSHKGKLSVRCNVHGLESHSGLAHRGANAVEAAAETIARLKSVARRCRDQGPFDTEFDPAYSTVHTGTVSGGTQLNIVPSHCTFEFEIRHLPTDDPTTLVSEVREFVDAQILPEMRAVHPEAKFDWQTLTQYPAFEAAPDSASVKLALDLAGGESTGKVSFGTEAGLFAEAGIASVICGPGEIKHAHKPDEYVEQSQLQACESFVDKLIERSCMD